MHKRQVAARGPGRKGESESASNHRYGRRDPSLSSGPSKKFLQNEGALIQLPGPKCVSSMDSNPLHFGVGSPRIVIYVYIYIYCAEQPIPPAPVSLRTGEKARQLPENHPLLAHVGFMVL